jgi:hypothetical protein
MHSARHPLIFTEHKLARLAAWALLWLAKYVVFLVHGGDEAKQHLHSMSRMVGWLVVHRAARLVARRAPQRRHYPPSAAAGFRKRRAKYRKSTLRAYIGGALHRELRARNPGEVFAKLVNALRNLDAHARTVAQRLARRISRLCPILPAQPPAHALISLAAPAAFAADTS